MPVNLAASSKGRVAIPAAAPLPGARTALALLLMINLFNYIDRQVLAAVEPEIRKDLFPESVAPGVSDEVVALAKFRMGLLSDAFLITYMLAAPLFGVLAHRFSRWLLICFGVTCWSLASGASGWNWGPMLGFSFWMLFVTRCFVGVGEAAYGPIAPAVLSDLFPKERRGKIMSYFYLAIPVGGALGYTLGGQVGGSELGWRWAFYLVVPPGLLLGLWSFLMWEPGRTEQGTHKENGRPLTRHDYLQLARTPSYVLNTLGMAAMTFAIGGLAFWMPDYLDWRRDKLGEMTDLGGVGGRTLFGAVTVLAGLLATLAGGFAGDWLRPKFSGSYFIVSGAAMLLGFPAIVCLTQTPFPAAWLFVFVAVFCLFFNTGPTNTILANVTQPSVRAAAFALNIFLIHVLGDVLSPPLMGYLAGLYGRNLSFLVVSAAVLVGGVLWLWGALYLQRDTERAELLAS
jgi:MFS family permease